MSAFTLLYWLDWFVSIGKPEINPLYSSTNKFIFFPMLISSVILLKKMFPAKAKYASVFLLSIFAFAFVWNLPFVMADDLLYNQTVTSGTTSFGSSAFNGLEAQVVPSLLIGKQITAWTIAKDCNDGATVTAGVAQIDSANTITNVHRTFETSFPADGVGLSLSTHTFNLSLSSTPFTLSALPSGNRYILFFNSSDNCNVGVAKFTTATSGIVADSAERRFNISTAPLYIGSPTTASTVSWVYAVYGFPTVAFNQTATSVCNSLNGASCSSTTSPVTLPSDCSSDFSARLTHSLNLFNGTVQPQFATATSEYILPAGNQFSNVTIIDWTNNTTRNVNLTFSKTNYNAGDTIQARCSLAMNQNTTGGTSTCSLAVSCSRTLETEEEDSDVIANPFVPVTQGDTMVLTQQILDVFLTPFFLFTIAALVIAGGTALSFKQHAGIIFVVIFFVITMAYTVIGVYPLFLGIVIVFGIVIVLTKMVMSMLKT